MKRRYFYLLTTILLLAGCDQQQVTAATENFSANYLRSHRDSVIRNWQNKVSDDPRCASFKARFKAAGERHESAASAPFAGDMMKIWEDGKAASCQYSP